MKEYTPQNPVFSDKFNLVERADNVNAQIHNASVKQAMDNTVALKKQLDSYMGSVEDGKPQFADGIESGDVVGAINEVFTLGSEKKAQLVENLTAMGMQASTSDTWEVLLEKILDMTDTSGDTVTAPVLLTGYTAHDASGEQINGVMPEMATVTVEAVSTTQDSEYTYLGMPEGHYDENSKVRTKNSNLQANIEYIYHQHSPSCYTNCTGSWSFSHTERNDSGDYFNVYYCSICNYRVRVNNVDSPPSKCPSKVLTCKYKEGEIESAKIVYNKKLN